MEEDDLEEDDLEEDDDLEEEEGDEGFQMENHANLNQAGESDDTFQEQVARTGTAEDQGNSSRNSLASEPTSRAPRRVKGQAAGTSTQRRDSGSRCRAQGRTA